ncbi:ABC transporter permease, partial [uncultured Ruminococcus sp.]|uniref:ABC transporter permease n=1 Tax=uncultured Ruminococcus sp. TaxID=165186 RepID=UPI0025EFD96B
MVKLIKAGFHKDRTILAVFMLIIILSTFLLHTGLLASTYGSLYREYAEEEDLSDLYVFAATSGQDISDVLDGKEYIESYRSTDVVNLNSFSLKVGSDGKKKDAEDWMITSLEDNCCCNRLEFVERDDSVPGEKIYLNIYTAYSNGLSVGDTVYIDSDMGKYEYTVAGIFQHLFMGNTYSYYGAMVDNEEYERLHEDCERYVQSGGTVICDKILNVNIKEGHDIESSLNAINAALLNEKGIYSNGFTRDLGAEGFTIIVNIMAGFMAAFAVIMLIICVIMIVFTISNNLSRDIINIGALRAVGYTVGQIRLALVAEYLILGSVGSLIGISASYGAYPVLECSFIREISGLIWKNRFFTVQTSAVFFGVLLVIVMTVFASAKKLRSLHPATALRFGLRSDSFRKNHLPLADTKGELNLLLAIKSTLQSMGQGVIIFCIVASVSFVTMFSLVMYYNTKVDISKFQRMVNGDVPDAYVYLKDTSAKEAHRVIDKLNGIDGVSQAYTLEVVPAEIGDSKVTLIYTSSPECVDCGIYEGEMLREDNEAVIGSSLA